MAIIKVPAKSSHVFFQQWSDTTGAPGEPAIIIEEYSNEICFSQNDNEVMLSKHELGAFIKHLQKIKKGV